MKDLNMLELKIDECQEVSGGDCMGAFGFGGAAIGGAIGAAAGFFGGFGFGAAPGFSAGAGIGGVVGTIGGAYFCYP
jgi:hypothetical protein